MLHFHIEYMSLFDDYRALDYVDFQCDCKGKLHSKLILTSIETEHQILKISPSSDENIRK